MMGGQPFWRDIDVPRASALISHAEQLHAVELQEQAAQRGWLIAPHMAVRLAATLWNVDELALISHRRAIQLVEARALATWVLRNVPAQPMSYPRIGRALGGRDHATIINLHRMAIRLRLENEMFSKCCRAIAEYCELTQNREAFDASR